MIFDVGFNKSGTTSFASAMSYLGYNVLHGRRGKFNPAVPLQRAKKEKAPWLTYFPREYEVLTDMRFVRDHYRELHEQHPDSKFILLWRDLEDWLNSREAHVIRNRMRKEKGCYHGKWLEIDKDKWASEYKTHTADVRNYFDNSKNYLELNICAGEGWEKLCSFLNVDIPDIPFPHKLRGARKFYGKDYHPVYSKRKY